MDFSEALQVCHKIVAQSAATEDESHVKSTQALSTVNILSYLDHVVDIIKAWPKETREQATKLGDFLITLKGFRDNAESIISADPMGTLYRPAHDVTRAFERSQAFIRYLYSGNRCEKTTAANVDTYRYLTGYHPHRALPPAPLACFAIGPNFTKYAANVWERKWISGEPGNLLSPIFPVGGKWLYKYDDRKHIIYLACKACATEGKAQSCSHLKSTHTLYSDTEGPLVLAGGQFAQGHLDEQISKEIFVEARERTKTIPNSSLVITETPLNGETFWTYTDIYLKSLAPQHENWNPARNAPVIECFTIDQYSAGLVAHEEIEASKLTMTEPEIRVRIYGEFASARENAVFDQTILHTMNEELREPKIQAHLVFPQELKGVHAANIIESGDYYNSRLGLAESPTGHLYIWEPPKYGEQYVIGVDVAFGLTKKDFSAAPIFKLVPVGLDIELEQVGLYRGWVDTLTYAADLFKLGYYYREATLVIENNGPGLAVISFLAEKFNYPNLFHDATNKSEEMLQQGSDIGVNTNVRTKAMMISILQSIIKAKGQRKPSIVVRSKIMLEELKAYVQEATPTGVRFQAAGTAHDDTVIGTVLAAYAARTFPIYDSERAYEEKKTSRAKNVQQTEDERRLWEAVEKQRTDAARSQEELERMEDYDDLRDPAR